MLRGFVFGKYYPFHIGHKALIDFACSRCDKLFVVVCASDQESISGALRLQWIQETYQELPSVTVILFNYDEARLPNTSVTSREVSRIWADEFLKILPPVEVVFTSEAYGDYLAEYMQIKHESYDPDRNLYPISSTAIRANPHDFWSFIPKAVRPYYVKKIVLLGTESTGKTTMSKYLAAMFEATLVPEAARDMIPDSKQITLEDLYEVAFKQFELIRDAACGDKPIIVIDTDLYITNSYAQFIFGQTLELPDDVYEITKADLYLYLNNDVPYHQDGTRLPLQQRDFLDRSHRNILNKHKVELTEVKGNWSERNEIAKKAVKSLLKTYVDFE